MSTPKVHESGVWTVELAEGTLVFLPRDLPEEIRPDGWHTLAELEADAIRAAMSRTGGHRANAAALLGISERTLYRKLKGVAP